MKNAFLVLGLFLAFGFLSGCGSTFLNDPIDTDNPQAFAGVNYALVDFEVEFGPDGEPIVYPDEVEIYGGKDNDLVLVEFEMPNGLKAIYRAEGSSGVTQVQARAALETALSSDQKEVVNNIFPDGLDGLVRSLVDAGVVAP